MSTSTPTLNYTTVKHVTRPLLKFDGDKPLFITVESAIRKADPVTATRARTTGDGEQKETMAPPELFDVLDLLHGDRPCQMIVNTVLGSQLKKTYPGDKYVGKSFKIEKAQLQGKRYATFSIQEIQVTTDDAPTKKTK